MPKVFISLCAVCCYFYCCAGARLPSLGEKSLVSLLIDAATVQRRPEGWEVRVQQPTKASENPLLLETDLWDLRWDNTYPTVLYDADKKLYRMWYNTFVSGVTPHPSWKFPSHIKPWKGPGSGRSGATLYAESSDGVHWEKIRFSGAVPFPWNGTIA